MRTQNLACPALVLLGGETDTELNDACWRMTTDGWKKFTQLPESLHSHSVCETEEGFMVVGGRDKQDQAKKSCHHYNIRNEKWFQIEKS